MISIWLLEKIEDADGADHINLEEKNKIHLFRQTASAMSVYYFIEQEKMKREVERKGIIQNNDNKIDRHHHRCHYEKSKRI